MEHLLERAHDLCRAVAGRGRGVDLRAAVQVEAHRELRTRNVAHRGQRRQGDRLTVLVAHVELPDVLDVGTELALSLDVDLPLPPETVEVVDEAAAKEGLQRLVHVFDVDALLEHFVAVHVDEQLGNDRTECAGHAGQLGALARRLQELVGLLGQERDVLARTVLQDESGAARHADALDCRRRERKRNGPVDASQPFRQLGLDRTVLFLRLLALGPFLEGDEEKRAVRVLHLAQHVESHHGGDVLDAGDILDQVLGLAGDFRSSLQRARIGELHAGKDVALVLVGQKTGRQCLAEQASQRRDADDEHQTDHALADRQATDADIAASDTAEELVEPVVELLQCAGSLDLRAQQQRAQGGAQGQGVERRDDHGNRDRHRELLVQLAGDARNERGGHENGGKNDRDRDHRTGHFAHRLERGILWRQALLDVVLDRLDDHDGIVHNQSDRQHQSEQRQRVDREPEQREKHEGADQRHRHREQRNQGRAPALEEDEHDDDHQHQRFEQRFLDFVDAFGHRKRGVERDHVVQIGRESLLDLFHQRLGTVGGFERVGAGDLIQGDQRRRLAVQPAFHAVGLCTEFNPRDVGNPHDRAVRVGPQDHLAEVLLGHQPALGAHRVGELLAGGHRLRPDLASRVDGVLGLDGVDDLRDRDVELGEHVGPHPQTHRVLSGAEHRDTGDPLDPRHLVVDVDVRIVGQEDVVVGAVRRVKREHEQR